MHSRQHYSFSFVTRLAVLFLCLAALLPRHAAAQSQTPQSSQHQPTAALRALADRGDSAAQYRLAKFILTHNPSSNDIPTALNYLRASVAQNNPDAEFYLGYLYEHGQFVSKDYALAFQNYEAATRVHYPPAENNLASLYQHGQGVPKNLGKTFDWYLAAAQHGNPVGQLNLANLYYGGEGVPRNTQEAVRWLRLSADSGLPEAQSNLAYFYFYGIVVPRDYSEAARLVRLAAQQNLPGAQISLAYLYEQGKGVPLDYIAAYTWYSRAIANGDQAGAKNRNHLARIMTPNQLNQANAIITAQAPSCGSAQNSNCAPTSVSNQSPQPPHPRAQPRPPFPYSATNAFPRRGLPLPFVRSLHRG